MKATRSATSDQRKRPLTGNRLKSNFLSGGVLSLIVAVGLATSIAGLAADSVWCAEPMTRELKPGPVPAGLAVNAAHIWGPDAELDRIAATGVQYVRHGTGWEGIETSKGEYDFSRFDAFYDAMAKRGVGVIFILAYNNKLYEPHGRREIVTDEGREAYARWAAAFVKHFKGKNVIWELWNEPNTKAFWGAPPNSKRIATDYVKLVKAAVPAMREADPDCIILAGAVSNLWSKSYEWMGYAFEQGILEEDIDGWSVHPYGLKRPEDYLDAYAVVRDLMRKHGGATDLPPLLNTERGFPLKEAEGFAGGGVEGQEQFQANHFVRQYLIDQLCDVRITVWYAWQDEDFGLVAGREGAERPAYQAARVMVEQLKGYSLKQRIEFASDLDFVLLFENDQGEKKVVAWTSPPPKASPDQAKPHEVGLPMPGVKSVRIIELDGKSRTEPITGGKLTIELTASPVYIAPE